MRIEKNKIGKEQEIFAIEVKESTFVYGRLVVPILNFESNFLRGCSIIALYNYTKFVFDRDISLRRSFVEPPMWVVDYRRILKEIAIPISRSPFNDEEIIEIKYFKDYGKYYDRKMRPIDFVPDDFYNCDGFLTVGGAFSVARKIAQLPMYENPGFLNFGKQGYRYPIKILVSNEFFEGAREINSDANFYVSKLKTASSDLGLGCYEGAIHSIDGETVIFNIKTEINSELSGKVKLLTAFLRDEKFPKDTVIEVLTPKKYTHKLYSKNWDSFQP